MKGEIKILGLITTPSLSFLPEDLRKRIIPDDASSPDQYFIILTNDGVFRLRVFSREEVRGVLEKLSKIDGVSVMV